MRKGWEYKKLGEYVKEYSVKNKLNENIPVYSVTNSQGFCKDYFGKEVASKDKSTYKIVPFGFFAYNPSRINVGSIDWQAQEDRVIVSPLYNVFSVSAKLKQQYLLYYLKSPLTIHYIDSVATGTVRLNLKFSMLKEFIVPVPSIAKQEYIVSELDKINELIRLKKEQLKDFDNLAQSLFYEMFGDPVENEKGWEVKKLDNVCNITSSKRIFADEYTNTGIPFYRSKEVIERSKGLPISVELFISEERYNEIKEKFGVPKIGDILITAVGTIGKIWAIDTDNKFYFKDGNLVWLKDIDNQLANSCFFRRLLEYLIEEYKKTNANGAAYNALTIAKLKLMSCPLPPLSLQRLFAQRIEQIEREKSEVQKSIQDLETLLASRMQYWFE